MKSPKDMTIGAYLASAEARLATTGGYSAVVDCCASQVRLMETRPGKPEQMISQTDLPDGVAGEDVASALLDAHASAAHPEALAFAREVYFPILFR